MAKHKKRTLTYNEPFKNKKGNYAYVIEDDGKSKVRVRFENPAPGTLYSVEGWIDRQKLAPDVRNGSPVIAFNFCSPFDKTIHKDLNSGAFIGGFEYTDSTHPRVYRCWKNMLYRVFSSLNHILGPQQWQEKYPTLEEAQAAGIVGEAVINEGQLKYPWNKKKLNDAAGKFGSYLGVGVADEFLNFQLFAAWCIQQPGYNKEKWELDKDLLSPKGDKKYSMETCCFLPSKINSALRHWKDGEGMGEKVASLAEQYQAELDPRAYAALVNLRDK